ncbi:MAG: adenylosuccinate synthase [Dehalococcoidia bacterium]|uniref:adenylosuccinate synthase n=1 Tax=Candidatus Amarobacter glycogenicus TaxID=3140699 RepID=UPI002A150B98|nr:adenylosuccinate synthase [Dehalococcoidia bacterium]MBK6563078.1 adenylosuccinate synthase [Dehalococcoidia bacterium]MBK7329660.1 adenylosuccinate synthase [Dehalococcoidia bacterium]MBK9342861.1 adenylosuccinate synthase [Dehalococcoidia bacterium]MBK9612683.1 adenylosuccinate synthase [Dehalococcoidia bacterium]
MPIVVVVGGQWGDEGKGRIVDLLARKAKVVARYSAGNNAGHTIVNERGEFKLNLVPAGIFYPEKTCVIGNGVAVDPGVLLGEIEGLQAKGIDTSKLVLSDRAQLVMPWHIALDKLDEASRGATAIGTTGKGIGPCFVDKVARRGIRVADLLRPEDLIPRMKNSLDYANRVITGVYGGEPIDFDSCYQAYHDYGLRLSPYIADVQGVVFDAHRRGEYVLLEGAQGSLLDLDHGTYPYVTSSVPSSSSGGAAIGVGIGPTDIQRVVGVFKSYCTRVGNGPFPTELFDDVAATLRDHGKEFGRGEYGTTTGRPRRIGWLDAVAARYSVRFNGLSALALTRLDVLDNMPTIKICTGYELDGKIISSFPSRESTLERIKPIYEELPGWMTPTTEVRTFDDLPPQARAFIKRVEELLECPVDLISVGPSREQAVIVNPIF